jgi:hypothetical protein
MSTSSSEGGPSTPGEHPWTGQAADPRGPADRTRVERPLLLRCGRPAVGTLRVLSPRMTVKT